MCIRDSARRAHALCTGQALAAGGGPATGTAPGRELPLRRGARGRGATALGLRGGLPMSLTEERLETLAEHLHLPDLPVLLPEVAEAAVAGEHSYARSSEAAAQAARSSAVKRA